MIGCARAPIDFHSLWDEPWRRIHGIQPFAGGTLEGGALGGVLEDLPIDVALDVNTGGQLCLRRFRSEQRAGRTSNEANDVRTPNVLHYALQFLDRIGVVVAHP